MLAFVCLHMFVSIRGKDLLSQKLQETFNRKVKIGVLRTAFPANIYIKDLEVDGLFKIDEIIVGRGLIDIFSRDFNLSFLKVKNPVITLEKLPEKAPQEQAVAAAVQQATIQQAAQEEHISNKLKQARSPYFSSFAIGRLIVSEGALNFIDRSMLDKEIIIRAEHLNLRIDNLNLSGKGIQVASFNLKGVIPWRESVEKGKIEAEGWINLAKRDMQATIKIKDIDGIYLYPYYSSWLNLEKAGIEKANLNFTSNIHGLNNNVAAECHLELTDIVRKPKPAEEPVQREERIASAVLDMFKNLDQGRIVLDFTIRTKMDRPEFGLGNIKMAFKEKVAQARGAASVGPETVLRLPVRLVEGVVKGATNVSKAMVDGTFALGKEIKKSLEQSFKKESK